MSNIKVLRHGLELPFKSFKFPGGEIGVKIATNSVAADARTLAFAPGPHTIVARLKSADDILELMMVKDALDKLFPDTHTMLFMPYVPYARQDRVCDKGESFSLKVFANLINSLQFNLVTVVDPHSGVTPALLNNVRIINQKDVLHKWQAFIQRVLKGVTFISPDAGANKKVYDAASYFGHREFLRADKLRDMATGNILETIVYADDLNGRDVCILDDICDGGRTFIELAKVLKAKNAGKVILYVTHGIFSAGIDPLFSGGIDEIWTTDSLGIPKSKIATCYDEKVAVLSLEQKFLV